MAVVIAIVAVFVTVVVNMLVSLGFIFSSLADSNGVACGCWCPSWLAGSATTICGSCMGCRGIEAAVAVDTTRRAFIMVNLMFAVVVDVVVLV